MAITIEQPKVIEVSDFQFKVVFIYKAHSLETVNIERGADRTTVNSAIIEICEQWDLFRADENFQAIKEALEVDQVVL